MNIYVGGVNGVGKSTILRRVAQVDKRFEVIHFTSAIEQQLGLTVGDYNALHTISNPTRDKAAHEVISSLVARETIKIRLIDGHYLNIVFGKVHDITGPWIERLDALVLARADFEVIWQRIKQDESYRDRELFSGSDNATNQKTLEGYITQTSEKFHQLAKRYQKDHFVLTHNDDDVDRAARQLINFCQAVQA